MVFGLVVTMLSGLIFLLHDMVYRNQASQYLLFSYSLISMCGSLLFLGNPRIPLSWTLLIVNLFGRCLLLQAEHR